MASHKPQPATLSTSDIVQLEGLVRNVLDGARLLRAVPLKPDRDLGGATHKGTGYGAPIRLDVTHGGGLRSLVLHTATRNEFGHDRRADRAAEMLLAADTFSCIDGHVRVLDVGAYRVGGGTVSLRNSGEFYLLTTWAEGTLYADDLRAIAARGQANERDLRRVEALAERLVRLHAEVLDDRAAYERSVRDLVGGGEGIFGIIDAYSADTPAAPPERLLRLEQLACAWRERLKKRPERLRRIHGDYHPFNVLFDDQDQVALLDTSRGSAGDPADDLSAMAVNFLFFGLETPSAWANGFGVLWHRFWSAYLAGTSDGELGEVIAPYFAWRALVVGCPRWYPDARVETRERLLGFVERLLAGEPFRAAMAEELFA